MTTEAVKKRIQKKHGTISAFARVANIDRYDLQKMFARKALTKEEQKTILDKLQETSPEAVGIPPEKLELLRSKLQEAGGVYKFCKDHPEFEKRHVYRAYKGGYVSGGGMAQRLMDYFSI